MAVIKEGTKWVFKENLGVDSSEWYRVNAKFHLKTRPSVTLDLYYDSFVITNGSLQYETKEYESEIVVYWSEGHEGIKGWVDEAFRTIIFDEDVEIEDEVLARLRELLESEVIPPEPEDIFHKGEVSGIGNKITRENEITADHVAVFRNFAVVHESGIISDSNHDFYATVIEDSNGYGNTIHITDGRCFAYGYFGYANACDFTFLPPAVEQYHVIYVEIDRSVIPNTCIIKTRNNQSNPNINPNTFRQDVLSLVKTGVYQIPLWKVKATNKGIQVEDLRINYDLRNTVSKIKNVVYSNRGKICTKRLLSNVTGYTEPEQKLDDTVATTAYVQREVKKEINK